MINDSSVLGNSVCSVISFACVNIFMRLEFALAKKNPNCLLLTKSIHYLHLNMHNNEKQGAGQLIFFNFFLLDLVRYWAFNHCSDLES